MTPRGMGGDTGVGSLRGMGGGMTELRVHAPRGKGSGTSGPGSRANAGAKLCRDYRLERSGCQYT